LIGSQGFTQKKRNEKRGKEDRHKLNQGNRKKDKRGKKKTKYSTRREYEMLAL